MQEEERERGVVSGSVWLLYLRSLGWCHVSALLIFYASSQTLTLGSSWWLGQWAADTFHSISHGKPWFYLIVYASASGSTALCILCRAFVMTFAALGAGRRIHERAARALCKAPMAFFDTTPLGRILNRFSADVQKVDVQIAPGIASLPPNIVALAGTLTLFVLNSPWILASLLPLGYLYSRVGAYYRASSREVQRLNSISKSPIYAGFAESLTGAATISAFRAQRRFEAINRAKLDYNQRAAFVAQAANRWLSVALEFLSNGEVASGNCFCLPSL